MLRAIRNSIKKEDTGISPMILRHNVAQCPTVKAVTRIRSLLQSPGLTDRASKLTKRM